MDELVLLDWNNNPLFTGIDLSNLDEIVEITITIMSGDEVLDILYTDGHSDHIDSSSDRIIDTYDGAYKLYSKYLGINRIEDFKIRIDSYSLLNESEDK